ncbi:Uncharacterised protein [uncultured archaeon]|nr:Uncharacterised protein [uncultured archaeon]
MRMRRSRVVGSGFDTSASINDRPHGSLNFQSIEKPECAFRRKMPLEAFFAIGVRLFGL